ncbi:hypothetical protein EVAR_66163_1 [Eumeta japonica]|uniref:Uncharacterized protein n=1 Tax=Eumeta variegata TaxID=151549 RepID=A0A4C1ZN94_EUMVA|nr:hypothetical protein EVAR_66163_1 [Eumeta japonica]
MLSERAMSTDEKQCKAACTTCRWRSGLSPSHRYSPSEASQMTIVGQRQRCCDLLLRYVVRTNMPIFLYLFQNGIDFVPNRSTRASERAITFDIKITALKMPEPVLCYFYPTLHSARELAESKRSLSQTDIHNLGEVTDVLSVSWVRMGHRNSHSVDETQQRPVSPRRGVLRPARSATARAPTGVVDHHKPPLSYSKRETRLSVA